ncbi:MAG TPA: hypothetical protein VEK13_01355 [Thermoplasmata archaeon]|nr:hypothetical protein [Thermoplasmata archaeon]
MPSPRATWVTFAALAVATVVIVSLFVWPGFYSNLSCRTQGASVESVNGRSYCTQIVPFPHDQSYSPEWGYGFHLSAFITPGGIVLNVTVSEPGGGTHSGSLSCGPVCPRNLTGWWFTPDGNAGVSWVETGPEMDAVTLLVSAS